MGLVWCAMIWGALLILHFFPVRVRVEHVDDSAEKAAKFMESLDSEESKQKRIRAQRYGEEEQ